MIDLIKRYYKRIIIAVLLLVNSAFLVVSLLNNNGQDQNMKISRELVPEEQSLVSKQRVILGKFNSKGYSPEKPNIIVNPMGNSPLTALLIFETDKEVETEIKVKGKDRSSNIKSSFPEAKIHYLPVIGLYPDKDNLVVLNVAGQTYEFTIRANEIPKDAFGTAKVVQSAASELTSSLYFFSPAGKDGYLSAYDINGDLRWILTDKLNWGIKQLKNGHMLVSTERLVNPPYYMTGLYEIDFLGKIINEYSLPGGYHHDWFELPSGNVLVASNEFNNSQGTVEDILVELDRNSGEITKQWDLKQILNMKDGQNENWTAYDWFHNNSVWYDESTNSITLSGRHQDAVVNLDYRETDQLNWIIGDPTGWSRDYQQYFFEPLADQDDFEWQWSQHAAMITPAGDVFLFDNGNNKSKDPTQYVPAEDSYSRGVMYRIDRENRTIEEIWSYGKERGSEFYSPYISDVDHLAEGHYIVHSGGIVYADGKIANQPAGLIESENISGQSNMVEWKDDQVVLELELPLNTYRVEKMDLSTGVPFEISAAKRTGDLTLTEVTSQTGKANLPEITPQDPQYQESRIELHNEEDRMVLKGEFKERTHVDLILANEAELRTYNVPISDKPYTAMCLDLTEQSASEERLTVYKYVNKTGLSGQYDIFLKINGKVYDTNKSIVVR